MKNEQFYDIKKTDLVEKAAKPIPNILEKFKLGQKRVKPNETSV